MQIFLVIRHSFGPFFENKFFHTKIFLDFSQKFGSKSTSKIISIENVGKNTTKLFLRNYWYSKMDWWEPCVLNECWWDAKICLTLNFQICSLNHQNLQPNYFLSLLQIEIAQQFHKSAHLGKKLNTDYLNFLVRAFCYYSKMKKANARLADKKRC